MSSDGHELTISDVCKDCGRDRSDLQVIQCNASNVHGYDFASGYINVLGIQPLYRSIGTVSALNYRITNPCREINRSPKSQPQPKL